MDELEAAEVAFRQAQVDTHTLWAKWQQAELALKRAAILSQEAYAEYLKARAVSDDASAAYLKVLNP